MNKPLFKLFYNGNSYPSILDYDEMLFRVNHFLDETFNDLEFALFISDDCGHPISEPLDITLDNRNDDTLRIVDISLI